MGKLTELKPIPGVMDKQVVAIVHELYPKYDKTIHSKVKRGHEYGITLRQDALDEISAKFNMDASDALRARGTDTHRYTRKVAGRVSNEIYDELQLYLKQDGFKTTQDWVDAQVMAYIKRKKRAAERRRS